MGITLFLMPSALFIVGIYLLSYKRLRAAGQTDFQEPAWLSSLAMSAQAVHHKEWKKQTATKFSQAWIKEYLSGQRSAFYAFLTWGLIVNLIINLIIVLTFLVFFPNSTNPYYYPETRIALALYKIFAMYILWACAANSTKFYKYFARILAGFAIITNVITIISLMI